MAAILNLVVLNAAMAVVLAAVVWLVAMLPWVRRRPGLRHCLWVVVLLKLLTPPLIELSILPNWFASEQMPTTHPRAIPFDDSALVSLTQTKDSGSQSLAVSTSSIDWKSTLVAISALGTVVILSRAMAQIWRLRQALRHGAPNDERLNQIATAGGRAMGVASPPPLCVVAANFAPLLWMRWSGPLIVVPRRLADELTDEQLGCVVAHEIAHILRRDHWTNLLSLFVAALFWWNPVVWWARRELRTAQEACCDAMVISRSVASRRKYAETLFQAFEFLQAERPLLPALTSGFGNSSSTERRFEMIANPLVNHRLPCWSYPVLLAALAVLPCLPAFTRAQDRESGFQAINDEFSTDAELIPVEYKGVDGDPYSRRVIVNYPIPNVAASFQPIAITLPGQTDRRVYKYHRSKRGVVVLAFELESGKLAWSSEIELPADRKAVAGRQFLLHTGGGIVTIAVVKDENSLTIQELDAQTGKVSAECQLARPAKDRLSESAREFEQQFKIRIEELLQRQKELQQQLKTEERPRSDRNDVSDGEPKEMEKRLKALKDQLQNLIDEQFIQAAEGALRGKANRAAEQGDRGFWRLKEGDINWQLEEAKDLGDVLVISTDGRPTIEMAGTVWRLINGDAPVESIRMVRNGGKDRMIIEGKGKKHSRIILEIRTERDKPGPNENDGAGTPPGGAAAQTGGGESLVEKAVQYFSRQRLRTPDDSFNYSPPSVR